MIAWKNTPIDQLSKGDLRLALVDSVEQILTKKTEGRSENVVLAYLLGVASSFSVLFLLLVITVAIG